MGKTILGALGILAVLMVVWLLYKPQESTRTSGVSDAVASFRDARFEQADRITIAKGKAAPVELKKAGSKWVVASSYAYPADSEKIDKILKGLDDVGQGETRGKIAHEEFEVDAKKGGVITAYAADGKELGKMVVGKSVPGTGIGSTKIFVRFGDDTTIYAVESNIRSDAGLWNKDVEAKNYLLKKVVSIGDDQEIESARLVRPDKTDVLVERKLKDVPVEKPKTEEDEKKAEEEAKKEGDPADAAAKDEKKEEEKKPETKKEEYFVATSGSETHEVGKSEEYNARGLLNRAKDFSIEDAVEPKDLAEYGLDKPQLQCVIRFKKKEPADAELKTVTFLFGNAKKDEKGENKGYYAAVDDAENKGRIYLVQTWTFDSWNKEMKDFLPKPKEEPKPAEAPKPDAAAPVPAPGAAPVPAPVPSGAPAPAAAPGSGAAPAPAPAPTPAPGSAPAPTPQAAPSGAPQASQPAPVPAPPAPAPASEKSAQAPPAPGQPAPPTPPAPSEKSEKSEK